MSDSAQAPATDPQAISLEEKATESDALTGRGGGNAQDDAGVLLPALITGTSQEYLGRRPLPRALRNRTVIVIAGPPGVGKTSVARRLSGDEVLHLEGRTLTGAVVSRIRNARWSDRYLQTANLIIDGPVFLAGRPGAARALGELICARQERGLRTILCEGEPRDGSIGLLMDAVRPEHRATLTLRFPVGTGKRHFVKSLCRDLGIDLRNMAALLALEPWSYKVVLEAAEALLSCQDARSEAQDAPCGEAT